MVYQRESLVSYWHWIEMKVHRWICWGFRLSTEVGSSELILQLVTVASYFGSSASF